MVWRSGDCEEFGRASALRIHYWQDYAFEVLDSKIVSGLRE